MLFTRGAAVQPAARRKGGRHAQTHPDLGRRAACLAAGRGKSGRRPSGGRNEYAVKFVCGTNARPLSPAAAAGSYFTAINVHNPGNASVTFVHKVALAVPGGPGRHTSIIAPFSLAYDEATDVDCEQIAAELARGGIIPGSFFTGFFVIQATTPLDVVAVYTAAASRAGAVTTMTTERVPVRVRGGG